MTRVDADRLSAEQAAQLNKCGGKYFISQGTFVVGIYDIPCSRANLKALKHSF